MSHVGQFHVRRVIDSGKTEAVVQEELFTKACNVRHGIEILSAADCIQGKRVTTVPKCALDAEQGGATYVDEPVVVDGLLVTGRGYGENTEVLQEFLRMLKSC